MIRLIVALLLTGCAALWEPPAKDATGNTVTVVNAAGDVQSATEDEDCTAARKGNKDIVKQCNDVFAKCRKSSIMDRQLGINDCKEVHDCDRKVLESQQDVVKNARRK